MRIITVLPITKRRANLLAKEVLRLIIRQVGRRNRRIEPNKLYGLPLADPVEWAPNDRCVLREKRMKKLVLAILLIASPAWAQTKLLPKGVTARVDNCAPIGRTEDGKLVYSMKCQNLPAPPPPPPQAEVAPPPSPPEPEVKRSGIFGWSYERKRPDE
jgi:hypothetical protein